MITDELHGLLDDFRGFRHSYSFELDWEREKVAASRFLPALALLRRGVRTFLKKLDAIEEGGGK